MSLEKHCIDCKNCKDISLNPNKIKLYCEAAPGEIHEDSIVMIMGADECGDFQEKLSGIYF